MPVHLFFAGTEEKINTFLKENNGEQFNHYIIDNIPVFMSASQGSFPTVYLMKPNGETAYHWVGDEMNFSALDYLSDLEQ